MKNMNKKADENTNQVKTLMVSNLLEDLQNGLARYKRDDRGRGSIQEKYSLNTQEMKELSQCQALKHRKINTAALKQPRILVVDDVTRNNLKPRPKGKAVIEIINRLDNIESVQRVLERMH